MNAAVPSDPAEGLIREIEEEAAKERNAILRDAKSEAAAIVRHAFGEARRRMHNELLALRRVSERKLARATAQIETERRQREAARAAEILRNGCPDLINAVIERWADPAARRLWIAAMTEAASKRLPQGQWVVENPREWTAEDEAHLRSALQGKACLTFRASDQFEEGFRIVAGGATLDCTPERLLADKSVNQAMLLAEMYAELESAEALFRPLKHPAGEVR